MFGTQEAATPDKAGSSAIRPEDKVSFYLAILIGVSSLLLNLILVFGPMDKLANYATIDDTYYYIKSAQSWYYLGYPSFDGVEITNGLQPLWQFGVMPAILATNDLDIICRLVILSCVLLNLVSAAMIVVICAQLGSLRTANYAVSLWFLYMMVPSSATGMENAMHGVLYTIMIYLSLKGWYDHEWSLKNSTAALLGTSMFLMGMGRLDSGLICVFIFTAFAYRYLYHRRYLPLFIMFVLPAVGLGIYLVLNQVYMGSATPISGKTKALWAKQYIEFTGLSTIKVLIISAIDSVKVLVNAVLSSGGAGLYLHGGTLRHPVLTGAHASGLLLILALTFWSLLRQRRILAPVILISIAFLAHTYFLNWYLFDGGSRYWYYHPLRITLVILLGIGFVALTELSPKATRFAAVAIIFFSAGWLVTQRTVMLNQPIPTSESNERRMITDWLNKEAPMPEGSKIGSWNSGHLGYYTTKHQVVNLDGLVQSRAFFDEVVKGGRLKDYMRRRNIRYIVDNATMRSKDPTLFYGVIPYSQMTILRKDKLNLVADVSKWLESEDYNTVDTTAPFQFLKKPASK